MAQIFLGRGGRNRGGQASSPHSSTLNAGDKRQLVCFGGGCAGLGQGILLIIGTSHHCTMFSPNAIPVRTW